MQAFYEVESCGSEATAAVAGGIVRNFYLAAEKVLWSYAPSKKDLINNVSLTEADRWADMSNTLDWRVQPTVINDNTQGHCWVRGESLSSPMHFMNSASNTVIHASFLQTI